MTEEERKGEREWRRRDPPPPFTPRHKAGGTAARCKEAHKQQKRQRKREKGRRGDVVAGA